MCKMGGCAPSSWKAVRMLCCTRAIIACLDQMIELVDSNIVNNTRTLGDTNDYDGRIKKERSGWAEGRA